MRFTAILLTCVLAASVLLCGCGNSKLDIDSETEAPETEMEKRMKQTMPSAVDVMGPVYLDPETKLFYPADDESAKARGLKSIPRQMAIMQGYKPAQ